MLDILVFAGEIILTIYTYRLIDRLAKYYIDTFGWNPNPQRKMALRLFLSFSAAIVCLDKEVLQSSIARINALEPDVVILGGDIVEEETSKADMQEVFCHLGYAGASDVLSARVWV